MRQSSRSAREQVQTRGDHGVRRRFQPQPLRQHEPQDHARLGIVRERFPRCTVDQGVEIDQPAQRLARNRARERLVLEFAHILGGAGKGDIERFAATQDRVEQAQRRTARMNSGGLSHYAPLPALETVRQLAHFIHMTERATQRPEGFEKPAHWTNDPPPPPKSSDYKEELSPTRYGDWVKDGIAIDF